MNDKYIAVSASAILSIALLATFHKISSFDVPLLGLGMLLFLIPIALATIAVIASNE